MPETNDSTYPVSEAAAAREKFEQEKMSRRAALRKIGLTSGMALFGMFAVDDFARLALRGLQQHKETQAVAETVAQELRSSGVAFAADGDDSGYYDAGPCTPTSSNQDSCTDGRIKKKKPCTGLSPCETCACVAQQEVGHCQRAYPVGNDRTFCERAATGKAAGCLYTYNC